MRGTSTETGDTWLWTNRFKRSAPALELRTKWPTVGMPWSGSFARCGLLMTSWTVVLLLSTELKFQRQAEPNVADVETTSTTSTVNTSNSTILPAFMKAPRGVAVCIAGNLRTFAVPVVFSQIRPFHEQLWGWTVSFFLYGTLAGAGPKNQTHRNLAAIHETNQTALKMALTSLRPEAVELVANAEDVTEENIAQYVLHQARVSEMV